MHICNALTLDHLLKLRDGEPVDAQVLSHVDQCAACGEELARLRNVQSALRALPSLIAPAYDGTMLRDRLHSLQPSRTGRIVAATLVGALSLLLIAAIYGVRERADSAAAVEAIAVETSVPAVEPTVNSLVIRSQELESRLRQLPRRPRIERASTSATIDTLQDHIQWVDYQLSLASDVGMTDRQSARLWQDRVELMDSLIKVRYAEAQRTAVLMNASFRSSL